MHNSEPVPLITAHRDPARSASPSSDDQRPITSLVKVSSLVADSSPRLDGTQTEHARLLAETDAASLPPILVHRETMRVIDGAHRILAAKIRGEDTIAAQLYEGSEDDAFVLAVQRNIVHGLPLSLADRKAAAARIIASHPNWSDRAIAACTALSGRTVRTIRQRSTAGSPQLNERGGQRDRVSRIGRDGRARPLRGLEGRRRASEIIAQRPTASLRAVADAAGVSLGTASDVRKKMRQGDDPIPARQRANAAPAASKAAPPPPNRPIVPGRKRDRRSTLEHLAMDPSLKYNDAGRRTLHWLSMHAIDTHDWRPLLAGLPAHWTEAVAELAQLSAQAWLDLAQTLQQQGQMAVGSTAGESAPRRGHSPPS